MGSLALAGHAVARFEALDTAAGEQAAAGVEAVGLDRSDSSFRYRGIEILRPFVGLERTRERLDVGEPVRGLVDGVHELRARVQLLALEDSEELASLAAKARRLAREACAPPFGWMADALLRLPDAELAAATAARLRAMGALASAAQLSGSRVG